MDLTDQPTLITGAAAGFGRALTERLLAEGARVAALDCDGERLAQLAAEQPEVLPIVCDVADPAAVEAAVAQVTERLGGIRILINNAGIMRSAPLLNPLDRTDPRHPLDLWHQVLDVNLNGVFYLTRAVAADMLQRRARGVIVNVSSISARGNAGQSAYSAAKAAVEALTVVWAKELGRLGIRVAAIAPGFCDTQGTADALEAAQLASWVDQVPLKRMGKVEEMVDALLWILQADYFNGRVLELDGGLRL
ncbi:SDR family NAD(P)-dependent oxidoreductase [Thiorhodovibrio litoralis]|uniref:SDR family NAD(P)-dependent oxidoreductase n=1 Tax=Thiorhodovibrio litoralis TaxID=2952932 RepID=UPI002B25ECC4|nr:SDR family NAD(P)-dependent oxidoreductase [Thiorhodovibrio litoralis]WPL14175.1 3-oxoacyl-[acyl-carrier-protein] reductase FabG [Thiorhodovibrio litoralis]